MSNLIILGQILAIAEWILFGAMWVIDGCKIGQIIFYSILTALMVLELQGIYKKKFGYSVFSVVYRCIILALLGTLLGLLGRILYNEGAEMIV